MITDTLSEVEVLKMFVDPAKDCLQILREMFNAFPYAEKDGDDETITKLADALKAYDSWKLNQEAMKVRF